MIVPNIIPHKNIISMHIPQIFAHGSLLNRKFRYLHLKQMHNDILKERNDLRKDYPILKVMRTDDIDLGESDKDIYDEILEHFKDYEDAIDDAVEELRDGDFPIERLDYTNSF